MHWPKHTNMQEVPCTQVYALHTMATLFNNHPLGYISSSGTLFIATYVRMIVVWSVYHCVTFLVCVLCQSVHSLNHLYIMQLESFLEICYGNAL